MGNLIKSANNAVVTSLAGFIQRGSAGSTLKYQAEKNTRHRVLFPETIVTETDENGNTSETVSIIAKAFKVHEWTGPDGKFKTALCLKQFGSECPVCDRTADGWEIRAFRKEREEANCTLTGDARTKHFEEFGKVLHQERKAKEPKDYLYVLCCQYKLNPDGTPVLGKDSLPEFDIKVMRISFSRAKTIEEQFSNNGMNMAGSEMIFAYGNYDDKAQLVGQCTPSPIFANVSFYEQYAGLKEKVAAAVNEFSWNDIDKAFSELGDVNEENLKQQMDRCFAQWDAFKKERETNPNARYGEYSDGQQTQMPSLGNMGAFGGGVPMPQVAPQAGQFTQQPQPAQPQLGGLGNMFSGAQTPMFNQ